MYGEVNGVNNEIDVFEFWNPHNMFGKYSPKKLSMIHHMTVHYNKKMSSKSYVVFDNITFKGANGNGLNISGGTNNYINNCDILFSGKDGVQASGINFKLENSKILNSNNDGVNVSGALASIVRNNTIKNSYCIAGMGQSGNGEGAGVRNGSQGRVEYNQIINSGFVFCYEFRFCLLLT